MLIIKISKNEIKKTFLEDILNRFFVNIIKIDTDNSIIFCADLTSQKGNIIFTPIIPIKTRKIYINNNRMEYARLHSEKILEILKSHSKTAGGKLQL